MTLRDHFADPPPRRVSALGVVRNSAGAVLFTENADRRGAHAPLYHPGGCAEANESVTEALSRLAFARLGIDLVPGRLLAVHHMHEEMHPEGLSREGFNYIFDCGVLDLGPDDFKPGEGVRGGRWVHPEEFGEVLMPFTAQRTIVALEALAGGEVKLLTGHPPVE